MGKKDTIAPYIDTIYTNKKWRKKNKMKCKKDWKTSGSEPGR